jgi:ketosteroid isomerase-like protein
MEHDLITKAYAAFNARDIDGVLALMHPTVVWPNGMEGGYMEGQEAVREYWTRQWKLIDPHVEVQGFTTDDTGRIVVDVHQVVHDLGGHLLSDEMIQHSYWIEDGLIRSMEIQKTQDRPAIATP